MNELTKSIEFYKQEMLLSLLDGIKHSPVQNYAGIPGLISWRLSSQLDGGMLRMFECTREHKSTNLITPHSHRYDFQCLVLEGSVTNIIWEESDSEEGDLFESKFLVKVGDEFQQAGNPRVSRYTTSEHEYFKGEMYAMNNEQIHSIIFSKGAKVLFVEGKQISKGSTILQPYVDNETIPTFRVEPWMYKSNC